MKRRILFTLLLCTALLLALPAWATDEPEVLDPEEIDRLLEPYLEEYKVTEKNLGIAFLYTATGETYFLHGEQHFYSASLYKVPLCMRYAERISKGELDWSTQWKGSTMERMISRTLLYSDNSTAGGLIYMDNALLYGDNIFGLYSGYSEEAQNALGSDYQFTPRYMLNTLRTLFEEPERFPRILDYMKDAAPGEFFEEILGDRYEIAQKYGQWNGVLHTAGVIYTPTPILLVVMCDHLPQQKEAISRLAELFSDYSLTLDERREAIHAREEEERRLAEEAAEAEKARIAEAERVKAEEAARAAAEEAQRQKVAGDAEAVSRRLLLEASGCFGIAFVLIFKAWQLRKKQFK